MFKIAEWLLIIYIIYFALRTLLRPFFIKQFKQQGRDNTTGHKRPGETYISARPKKKSSKAKKEEEGEYIDYKEIK